MSRVSLTLLLALGSVTGVNCRSDVSRSTTPRLARTAVAAQDAETAAVVDRVLESAKHPWMHWPAITDVAPDVKPLYDSEPDRLLWFDDERPARVLAPTIATIAKAADYGLDPADYDATALGDRWKAMTSGKPSATDRATFDVAVTAAVARMLTAVRVGRVDPRTLDWGYDVAQKEFDVAAAVEDVRDGKALATALEGLQPSFTHYTRALKTLASYRALVANGEPPAVPDLPKGRKIEPGKSWTGVPQLAARLRNVGDLPQNADIASGRDALFGAARGRGEELSGAPWPRRRRRARVDDDPDDQRADRAARASDRARDGADALAAHAERSPQRVRERRALPALGDRSGQPATSRSG